MNGRLLLRRVRQLYGEKRLPRAASALSFHLTATVFPLLIILYTLLGRGDARTGELLALGRELMAGRSVEILGEFLRYVENNNSSAMTTAALLLLVSSASAAVRTLGATVGDLQGKQRYRGLRDLLFSVIFSLVFTTAIYFAVLVMLSGEAVLNWLSAYLPGFDAAAAWRALRYPLLAGIDYAIICAAYRLAMADEERYPIHAGALAATGALLLSCLAFSAVIGASARYPLVYGSLASIILLMLWLQTCCLVICTGAALNVALRDLRREKNQRRFSL